MTPKAEKLYVIARERESGRESILRLRREQDPNEGIL